MIRPAIGRARNFFRSMAGQIFLILTLGMSVAAIVALLVAEQTRHHDFERIRRQRVLASAMDVADRFRRDPRRIETMMATHNIIGAAPAPEGISVNEPDADLESLLQARLGPQSQPEAGQVPIGLCFPDKYRTRELLAGLVDAPRPDCWVIRYTDGIGQRRALALSFPRMAKPPSTVFNPLYLIAYLVAPAATIWAFLARGPWRALAGVAIAAALLGGIGWIAGQPA